MHKRVLFAAISLLAVLSLAACTSQPAPAPTGGQQATGSAGQTAPAPAPAPAAKPPARWAMATSSSGSSPFVVGGIIADVANRHAAVAEVTPQVTGGFRENVSLVDKGEMQLGQVTLGQANGAAQQQPNLRALFNIQLSALHLVVAEQSSIQSIADLKGRRVNVGAPGQITRTLSSALLKTYGIGDDEYKAGELNTGEAIGALKDGQTDAVVVIATLPMPALSELAVSKPFRLLPITADKTDAYLGAIGGTGIPMTIPGGTYKGIDADVPTVAIVTTLVAHKDLDTETVYAFTKAVWENLPELQKAHASFVTMSAPQAVQGITLPLHPGAEQYFKEAGLR